MTKHDIVREAFKNNLGEISWNESHPNMVSRRLKNVGWNIAEKKVDAFKRELRSNGIDVSLVTIKTGLYTTVLYPKEWFKETV